ETVYFNELIGPTFGWIDTKVYDQTKDEQKAVGWCGQVLDTNGDGKITKPWNVSRVGNSALYLGDTAGGGPGARGPDAPFNPALAASSHLASFDVRKCKDLNGPAKVDGSQCREGWTLYQTTGPKLKGTDIPADFHYYNWVDQHNISGFGADTPFATGSNSDALLALTSRTHEWITLRVPYPLGFYSRGMDGRIDDANGGWKGRALYANYGTHFVSPLGR